MAERQTYNREFKIEIAKQVASGNQSARSMAGEIGVHENTIYKWVRQYTKDPEQAFTGNWAYEAGRRGIASCEAANPRAGGRGTNTKKFAAYMAKNDR